MDIDRKWRKRRVNSSGAMVFGALASLLVATACSEGGDSGADSSAGGGTKSSSPSAPANPVPSVPREPTPSPEPVVDTRTEAELIEAGRSTYNANCIACHAMDPRVDGALGPAVAGASLELLEARVMRGEYPEGYEPKRTSRVMVPLPHLESKLPELAAYLGSLR